jgi:hypothetical protein
MNIYTPNREKLKKFLLPPILFAIISCAVVIISIGFHTGALITCLIILAVVCTPFFLFILPTFLMEKIIIEDFTSTFYFVFLFFKFKQVIHIADIRTIKERYRNDKKGEPKEIVISTPGKTISLSEMKYTDETIKQMILDYKEKNPKIKVELLKN